MNEQGKIIEDALLMTCGFTSPSFRRQVLAEELNPQMDDIYQRSKNALNALQELNAQQKGLSVKACGFLSFCVSITLCFLFDFLRSCWSK